MEKKKITIVEDDKDHFNAMKDLLESEGYVVLGAPSGADLIKDVIPAQPKPDLYITDLSLPNVSGDIVISSIKKTGLLKDTPIIIISGKEDADIKKAAEAIGAKAWLKKPVNSKELLALVKKHIK